MLFTEWNLEDAIAVRYEEGLEDGLEKGRAEGLEEGKTDEKLEIARNLLAKDMTLEFVHDITGLDLETIAGLGN
jgi:predicted transposase/invertase (TIGR01784 family)